MTGRHEYEVTTLEAALTQLDWAIRLFIDHQAYIPAITLAGAAEELLGKLVTEQPPAMRQIIGSFSGGPHGVSDKSLASDYLNFAKNWLKHGGPSDKVVLELETEAVLYINRAHINLLLFDRTWPSEGPRFAKWVAENRPDLGEPPAPASTE